ELFLEGILEAPRGRRYAFQDCRYVAAHQEGPTANLFPCYDCNGNGANNCGSGGCGACGKDLHPMAAPGSWPPAGMTPHATFPGAGRDDMRPTGTGAPTALPNPSASPAGNSRLP